MRKFLPMLWGLLVWSGSNLVAQTIDDSVVVRYARIFQEIDSLVQLDQGQFWDTSLQGPILLIEPQSRRFFANQQDSAQSFQPIGEVFVDTLPPNLGMANTAIEFGGKRWTMVMLPLPKEAHLRNTLIMHEVFHRMQPSLGFGDLRQLPTDHLDSYKGRILMKLELEALLAAMEASTQEARLQHIQHALDFRQFRQQTDEIKQAENSLEINEALCEYTGIMLSGMGDSAIQEYVEQSVQQFFGEESYLRSFAYEAMPLYGYFLAANYPDWHKGMTRTTNLTDYMARAFGVIPDTTIAYAELARTAGYSFDEIECFERKRAEAREQLLEQYRSLFLEAPVLEISFQNMRISFDYRNLVPLGEAGTVYPNMQVQDNWGTLTVEEGALLASDWSRVSVSQPLKSNGKRIEGQGWVLELADGWTYSPEAMKIFKE